MTSWPDMSRNPIWRDKAVAFSARSRSELWGKHNEDMMAWFFLHGFKNLFIRDMLLGWNKRPKERRAENWGFSQADSALTDSVSNLFFPPGIVIPYVVDRHLEKLMIYTPEKTTGDPLHVIPGSARGHMVFGKGEKNVVIAGNILHGLLLFQEFSSDMAVIVPDPKTAEPPEIPRGTRVIYVPDPAAPQTETLSKILGVAPPSHTLLTFTTVDELIKKIDSELERHNL